MRAEIARRVEMTGPVKTYDIVYPCTEDTFYPETEKIFTISLFR